MRPKFDDQLDCNHGVVDLAVRCWAEEQADRMDWNHIKDHLTHISQIMWLTLFYLSTILREQNEPNFFLPRGFKATGSILDALLGQVETLTVALSDEISEIQRKIQREHDKYLKTLMLFVPRFVSQSVKRIILIVAHIYYRGEPTFWTFFFQEIDR